MIRTAVTSIRSIKIHPSKCCLKFPTVKYISTSSDHQTELRQSKNEWNTIYRLPIIGWAAALCKIKMYQAAVTTVAIPACYAAELNNILPAGSLIPISVLGITGTITLFIASYMTQNLIGFIYIDNKNSRLRISYVDFWGKRKDKYLLPDELQPPSDKLKLGFLSEVKTTNNETFKLLRRMGNVQDPNIFAYYFGE